MIIEIKNYTTQTGIPLPVAFLSIARFSYETLIRPTAHGPRHRKNRPKVEMLSGQLGVYLTPEDAAPAIDAAVIQPVELRPFSVMVPVIEQLPKGATLNGEIYAALLKQTPYATGTLIP